MSARDWILRRLISMLLTAGLHGCCGIDESTVAPAAHARHTTEQLQSQAVPARSRARSSAQPAASPAGTAGSPQA